MDQYQTMEQVFDAYMRHQISWNVAVKALQKLGMSIPEAEALVEAWDK